MTTEQALLAAVIAKPADDSPRLVYADWLEENGQTERAEVIRYQCKSGRHAEFIRDGLRFGSLSYTIANRYFFMARVAAWEWAGSPAKIANGIRIKVSRGFITEVHCTEEQWVGKSCEWCRPMGPRREFCPDCHGTGHVPGIGQRIAKTHPVEMVRTEKRPWGGSASYGWWNADRPGNREYSLDEFSVSLEIFDLIDGKDYGGRLKCFNTEQAALDAYSRAAIEWARMPQSFTVTFHYAGQIRPMPMDDQ